jgi:hypothetical protein
VFRSPARGLAQLELQTPAIVADLGIAPGFERAGFRQARAQFHRHQPLAALAEANHGFERRVLWSSSPGANSTTSPAYRRCASAN